MTAIEKKQNKIIEKLNQIIGCFETLLNHPYDLDSIKRLENLKSELADLKSKQSQRKNIEKVMALDEDDGLYNSDEPQPEQSAKNMKILSDMANQDELLADMELVQSAEERPKIEDYFKKGVTMSEVHKEYTGSPVLFKYAQALDSYIDEWINKWKGE